MAQAGGMAHDEKNPLFSERVREQLLIQRILVLDGVLDDDNGTLLATQLLTLAVEDPAADIAMWINSPGGSVPSMLAIRDVMRLVPCDVSTLALGLACSAGQFLLSAGAKGKRFALPHARILMHRGSAGIGGSAVDIEVQADDPASGLIRAARKAGACQLVIGSRRRSRWSRLLNGSTVADQVLRAAGDLPVQVVNVGQSDKTSDQGHRPRHDATQQG
jgi:ATP-dependent protease ClpP protease subunit